MHPLNIFGDGGGGAGVSVFQRMTVSTGVPKKVQVRDHLRGI